MIKRFVKKPVEIDAVQFTGNREEIETWVLGGGAKIGNWLFDGAQYSGFDILTLEGFMSAELNDWIIKGVKGEFYPCKPDIFEMTYEEVTDAGSTS